MNEKLNQIVKIILCNFVENPIPEVSLADGLVSLVWAGYPWMLEVWVTTDNNITYINFNQVDVGELLVVKFGDGIINVKFTSELPDILTGSVEDITK